MGIQTKTIYTCDCCGLESEKSDFNNGSQEGASKFLLSGHYGAISFGGDWGGSNYKIDQFLCFKCAEELKEKYSELKHSKLK